MGGTVAAKLAAFGAFVDDDVAPPGIGLNAEGHHFAATVGGAVAGIDVKVQGPQAEGAVVAGAVAQRGYLTTAVGAYKGGVIFGKAFLFHDVSFLFGIQNRKYRKGL